MWLAISYWKHLFHHNILTSTQLTFLWTKWQSLRYDQLVTVEFPFIELNATVDICVFSDFPWFLKLHASFLGILARLSPNMCRSTCALIAISTTIWFCASQHRACVFAYEASDPTSQCASSVSTFMTIRHRKGRTVKAIQRNIQYNLTLEVDMQVMVVVLTLRIAGQSDIIMKHMSLHVLMICQSFRNTWLQSTILSITPYAVHVIMMHMSLPSTL